MDRFFESNIPNLDRLRNSINQQTAFVAIDVEGMGDNIREIGIALLPFESLFMGYGCTGISLGFFAISHKVQAHNVRNQGFWHGVQRRALYEKFDCGKVRNLARNCWRDIPKGLFAQFLSLTDDEF
jgi:hypothetical protein